MKLELTATEQDDLLPNIKAVLATGKTWEAKELHHPAGAIIKAVLKIKGMKKGLSNKSANDGFSCNGWEWDWWQHFTHKGKRYTLSGSGHLGGHSFFLSDQQ